MEESNYKVGIYTRVSTDGQILDGRSLEWQYDTLMKYAEDHNYDVVDCYIEKGIRGESINNRPELLRLLNDVESGAINNVLVYKVDRLGRTVLTNSTIANILEKKHCCVTSSDFGTFDFSKATYSFVYNMLSSMSQFEVDNLSERVVNGKKKRAKLGLYINSNNVYGYDNKYDEITGTRLLKINDYESLIVKKIFKLYLDGWSMSKIAIQLENEKVYCKRGGNWRQSTILQILKNKLYIGKIIYNGNTKTDCFEVQGVHEPILDKTVFNKVQELISKKEGFKAKKFPNEYSYFSPYLVCSVCGSKFKAKQTKAKDKESIRYYCTNRDCSCNSIKHKQVESLFESLFQDEKISYDGSIIESMLDNDEYKKTISCLDTFYRRQDEFDELYSNGNLKIEDYKRQLAKLQDKTNVLLTRKKELELQLIKLDKKLELSIKKDINNIKESFGKLKNTDKQNFINLFVDSIDVDCKDGFLTINNLKWKY